MPKIYITKWKKFKIKDIFETLQNKKNIQVPTGASIPKSELVNGETPRITVSNYNNGILGYFSDINSPNYRVYENFISVSFLGTIFYQKKRSSIDMKVHCLKPLKINLNENIAIFLISVIKKSIDKFIYSDQLSSKVLPELVINLPVNELGEPDWTLMENYIIDIKLKVNKLIYDFQYLKNNINKPISLNKWKKFNLYDDNLFEIDSGTKLDKVNMTTNNPTILFIGRSNNNNGITMIVDKIKGITPYSAGNLTLSLGGEYLGSCFLQEKPFYTSQNVVVLKPKKNISNLAKRFIAAIIFKETQTYYKAFSDELNRHIKTDFSFYLPISSNNTPDFSYMEKYMEFIESKVKCKISIFN